MNVYNIPFNNDPAEAGNKTAAYSIPEGHYGIVTPWHPEFTMDGFSPFLVKSVAGSSPNVSGPTNFQCFKEILSAGMWINAYVRQAGQLNFTVEAQIDLFTDAIVSDQSDLAPNPVPLYLDQIANVDSGLGENDITATLQKFYNGNQNAIIEGRAITSAGTADSRWWDLKLYRPTKGESFWCEEGAALSGLGYHVAIYKKIVSA